MDSWGPTQGALSPSALRGHTTKERHHVDHFSLLHSHKVGSSSQHRDRDRWRLLCTFYFGAFYGGKTRFNEIYPLANYFMLETRCQRARAGLKPLILLSTGILSMCHHIWLPSCIRCVPCITADYRYDILQGL